MTGPSQKQRVLDALRSAGEHGVTSADFSGVIGTPDGLAPVPRFARCLHELRSKDGHDIVETDRERNRCKVYVLREARPMLTPVPDPVARLFAPEPASAIHGDEAA